jgi:TIR domain-containing protein
MGLFLSYRWGDALLESWVDFFAGDLQGRGYDVVYDRDPRHLSKPRDVVRLVAQLAECRFFVPILTGEYVVRARGEGTDDGWVYDEWRAATSLAAAKRLTFVGIWHSGSELPAPFTPESVVDLRDLARYHERMDETFPARKFLVLGMRSDETGRALGPLERRDVPAAVQKLTATGEFASVVLRDVTGQR